MKKDSCDINTHITKIKQEHLSTEERLQKLNSIYDNLLAWLFDCADERVGRGTGSVTYALEKVREEIKALGGQLKDEGNIKIGFELKMPKRKSS